MIGDEQSWFGSSRDYLPRWLRWTVSLVVQYFVAVVGSMLIGFFLPPAVAFVAFLLGGFVSTRIRNGQAATFVWAVGALWLSYGMYDSMSGWNASWSPEKTRWSYMLAQLFGQCSDTECLGELFVTTPFAASVTYSIGAYIAKRQAKRLAKTTSKEQ